MLQKIFQYLQSNAPMNERTAKQPKNEAQKTETYTYLERWIDRERECADEMGTKNSIFAENDEVQAQVRCKCVLGPGDSCESVFYNLHIVIHIYTS